MNEEHPPENKQRPDEKQGDAPTCEQLFQAEEALRRARAELRQAQQQYWELLREEENRLLHESADEGEQEMLLDEEMPWDEEDEWIEYEEISDSTHHHKILDHTLALIRKYPGPGAIVACVFGFLLARFLRK